MKFNKDLLKVLPENKMCVAWYYINTVNEILNDISFQNTKLTNSC